MALALAFFTLVNLSADLLGLADLLINRGVGFTTVAWIALLDMVPASIRSLPFAVLVGCHVAIGRLGADRELLALESCGIRPLRLLAPLVLFAALGAALCLALSIAAAPRARRALDARLLEAAREHPGAVLRSGEVHRIGDWMLEAREISPGGDELRGVAVFVPDVGEMVFAQSGEIARDEAGGMRVVLHSGRVLFPPSGQAREIRFERTEHQLPDPAQWAGRSEDATAGATLRELARTAEAAPDPELRREALEAWHGRIALSAAPLVFGLLALPLSLLRRRHSPSGGAALGIAVAVAYYALTYLGSGLLQGGWVSVATASWLPNTVVGGTALALLAYTLAREARLREERSRRRARRRAAPGSSPVRPRTLAVDRFIMSHFARVAVLCFGVLLAVFWVGDALDNLKWFARYHSTMGEILRFYGPRLAVLASRVLPMALLVAAALTLSQLGARGEVLGMYACGISPGRIARPVLVPCLLVALFAVGLQTEWVPRALARATHVKRAEIKGEVASGTGAIGVWRRTGDRLYGADLFDPVNGVAFGVRIYDLDPTGLPVRRTDAREARHVGDGLWRLAGAQQVEVGETGLVVGAAPPFVELGQQTADRTDVALLTATELQQVAVALERSGYAATRQRVELHARLASSLACFALPAVAAFLALGTSASGSSALALVWSLGVAIGHVLLTGVAAALGNGGVIPPMAAGWAPIALLAALAGWLASRHHGAARR